jgi:hypothetical protein
MEKRTCIISADFGTSSGCVSYEIVTDRFVEGQPTRTVNTSTKDTIKNWPCSAQQHTTGVHCLPMVAIYSTGTRELVYWGFAAQNRLDTSDPRVDRTKDFVIHSIKMLLQSAKDTRNVGQLHLPPKHISAQRNIRRVLGKTPEEIYREFATKVFSHVISNLKVKFAAVPGIFHDLHTELILCLPGGWKGAL